MGKLITNTPLWAVILLTLIYFSIQFLFPYDPYTGNWKQAMFGKPEAGQKLPALPENTSREPMKLSWDSLRGFMYQPPFPGRKDTGIPENVRKLDGEYIDIVGYMNPMEIDTNDMRVSIFFVTESTNSCCFGPQITYTDIIYIALPKGVYAEYVPITSTVRVKGFLRVDEFKDEAGNVLYIYKLEAMDILKKS